MDHSTIVRRLRKLEKVSKLAGWVLYDFIDNNKVERVWIFTDCNETSKPVSD